MNLQPREIDMKKCRLNIDTVFGGDHNAPAITAFIGRFSEVLYLGKGGFPTFIKKMDITPDFPLQCLVGLPVDDNTPAKQMLAEAYCQHLLGIEPINVWTEDRPWLPQNPNRKKAPLERCVFDTEFALSLGLSRGRWETDVLMSSSALARQDKLPNRAGMFAQNARLLLALAVYGFTDPWQFFTASNPA